MEKNYLRSPLLFPLFLPLATTVAAIPIITALRTISSPGRRALSATAPIEIVKYTCLHCILQPFKEFFLCHGLFHVRCWHPTTSLSWTRSLGSIMLGSNTSVHMKAWFVSVGWTSHSLSKFKYLYIHSLVRCDNSVFPQTRKFIDTIMRMQDILGVPLYGHYLPWSSFMIIDIKLHESFNSGIKHKLYYLAYIPFSSIIYLAISTNICRGSINLHIKMQKYNLTIFSKITCAVLQQTMNWLDAPCT